MKRRLTILAAMLFISVCTFAQNAEAKLYPNPAKAGSTVHVVFTDSTVNFHNAVLVNEAGKPLAIAPVQGQGPTITLNLPPVKRSMYFLRFSSPGTTKYAVQKVLIL